MYIYSVLVLINSHYGTICTSICQSEMLSVIYVRNNGTLMALFNLLMAINSQIGVHAFYQSNMFALIYPAHLKKVLCVV